MVQDTLPWGDLVGCDAAASSGSAAASAGSAGPCCSLAFDEGAELDEELEEEEEDEEEELDPLSLMALAVLF